MKIALIALMAVICLIGCSVMGTDSTSAESEIIPEVEENDPVEIEVDGETVEVDSFRYMGVTYAVTCTNESAQTVGVYGTYDEVGRTIPDHASIVVCEFSVGEDDVSYAVTSVLKEFKDNYYVETFLVLSETVSEFADGCFETMSPLSSLFVADPEYEGDKSESEQRETHIAELKTSTGYPGTMICASDIDNALIITLTFGCGEMNDNVKKNYNDDFADDGYTYTKDFVPIVTVVGCDFERPGFLMSAWADSTDKEISAESQAVYLGGSLFVDGEVYTGDDNVIAQWEEDNGYLADFEIEIKVPGYHICTITGTYEMWMMWGTVAIVIVLALIGLSAFCYRNILNRSA